ncbi:MAG: Hpt domain-containing protein [Gammaproteobacteria bacterium]
MNSGATLQLETLSWVKKELDAVLDQARQALESYIDNPADASSLTQVQEALRQVVGTLQMVELYGAAMLAQEMEALTRALIDDSIRGRDEAFEVLLRAILQLPDYLEHVQLGNRDMPIVLLPLLNDLRTARDASLLSEKVLFFPEGPPGPPPGTDDAGAAAMEDIRAVARRQRHNYQLALLGWFRGQDTRGSLDVLKGVAIKLFAASRHTEVKRLWWTTAALAESLSIGALQPNVTVKSLLGKIDREIKRLADQGEDQFASAIPDELSKNILYYVACAEDGSDLLRAVKQAYGLHELLPHSQTLVEARQRLAGPNLALLETVAGALREDLSVVKENLERFASGSDKDPRQLEPVVGRLHKIAETLDVLNLNAAGGRVAEQARILSDVVDGRRESSETLLACVAGVMLDAEIEINSLPATQAATDRRASGADAQPATSAAVDAEHRRLLSTVISEALRELERVKEAITGFISAPEDRSQAAELPAQLERIRAAMTMAHVTILPALLTSISDYVSTRLLAEPTLPDVTELESLADAITSVEYLLESLGKGTAPPHAILEIGRASAAKLGFPVDTGQMDDETTPAKPSGWTEINAAFAAGFVPDAARAGDVGPAVDGIWGAAHIENAVPGPAHTETETHESAPQAIAPAPSANDQRGLVALTGEADDEILEIFFEEAEEVLGVIRELLPKWRADSSDQQSLAVLRRSFHTLKGSGRLVGARLLGEFAWAFENLLNRVIEGEVSAADHIHQLLEQAADALAELIAQIKGQGAPGMDVMALMGAAHAMSKPDYRPARSMGRMTSDAAPSAGGVSPGTVESGPGAAGAPELPAVSRDDISTAGDLTPASPHAQESAARATDQTVDFEAERAAPADAGDHAPSLLSGARADGEAREAHRRRPPGETADAEPSAEAGREASGDTVLRDIFLNEARQHVGVLEAGLQAATEAGAALPVTDALLRALHTLNGSALTAGVPDITPICAPLERYAAARAAVDLPIPSAAIPLVKEALDAVNALLEALSASQRPSPGSDQVAERVAALLREEIARQTAELGAAPQAESVDILTGRGSMERMPAEQEEAVPHDDALAPAGARRADDDSAAAAPGQPHDRELVEIFIEEARDLMDASDRAMQRWQQNQHDKGAVSDLRRQLHTLKGGARMAGCAPIGDLSHALESLIISVVESRTAPSAALFDGLHAGFDHLHAMLEQTVKSQPLAPAGELIRRLEALRHRGTSAPVAARDSVSDDQVARDKPQPPEHVKIEPLALGLTEREPRAEGVEIEAPMVARAADAAAHTHGANELIRVSADLLDTLVNAAGEVNIYHSRLEQQITAFRFNLKELEQTVARLRDQLRKLEMETEAQILFRYEQEKSEQDTAFDPLELDRYSNMQQLSRALGESVNDLISIKEILVDQVRDSETLLLQQSRVSTDLQDGLMRTRMVPFRNLTPRLRRVMRQTAEELGKKVELVISGETSELDRSVLDRMVAPLEHMLRNAISHGIEFPEERRSKGKPETGRVRVTVAREANEIVIRVEDDGNGVDLDAVSHKARSLGLIKDDDKLSSHDIMQFILESGFSTADRVTQISGRGVGMDVVGAEVRQLGGVLNIDSTRGKGTSFTVRLPFTLAINQALLVQSGEDIYAVPLTSIEGIVRLSADELKHKYAQSAPVYEYAANVYELRHLGSLLGRSAPVLGEPHMMYPVMLVRAGDRRFALQAEGLLGNREVVVKPVGPQISKVRGISGATILGDGRVVLILDPVGLVRVGLGVHAAYSSEEPRLAAALDKALTVMVVDDSITIRKVTSRMLERNNFAVLTAKDGIDAVSQLHDSVPDVLLLDIEMPRMDGYELATYIRNNEQLRDIPIIMITSRTGSKHRERAMEIGVNRYLGKPYQENELLQNINEILAGRAGAAR